MEIFALEIIRTFTTKGVHGEVWPKHVYAVTQYTFHGSTYYFMARNTGRTVHAEDGIITHLEALLQNRKLVSQRIKLYLTYSPCHRCSQRIINFLDTANWCQGVHLEVDIVFSAFYQVRRPSCERNPLCRSRKHLPSEDEHWAQVDGLRKLYRTQGVVLRTLKGPDWIHLKAALGVNNFDCSSRQEEDNLLQRDFEQIVDLPFMFMRGRTTSQGRELVSVHTPCLPPERLISRFQDYRPTINPSPLDPAHRPSICNSPYYPSHVDYPHTRHPAAHGMPFLLDTYGLTSLPDIHGMPFLTATHGTPSLPATHGTPSLPDIHGTPSLPDIHGMPFLTATHGMPSLPGSHGMPFPRSEFSANLFYCFQFLSGIIATMAAPSSRDLFPRFPPHHSPSEAQPPPPCHGYPTPSHPLIRAPCDVP